MGRRGLALLAALCLLALPALAEVDTAVLDADTGLAAYPDDNGVDLIWRPLDQPFQGTAEEGTAVAFLDFAELANEGVVALRFVLTLQLDEALYADTLALRAGKKSWTFAVRPVTTEYDAVYQEDYTVPLGPAGLEMVQALAKNTGGTVSFTLEGGRTVSGTLAIPADRAAAVWKLYKAIGGPKQDLSVLEE